MLAVGVDGGKKRLQLLETLAVGVLHGGGLEDETEVLAQAALDGVVEREIEDAIGRFAGDDAAVERVLRRLRAVLSGGVVEALLGVRDRGAVGGCAGAAGLFLLRRAGSLCASPVPDPQPGAGRAPEHSEASA